MSEPRCPACHGTRSHLVDRIAVDAIVAAYADPALAIDTRSMFGADVSEIALRHCDDCDLKWFTPAIAGDAAFYEALQAHDWYYQVEKAEYGHAVELVSQLDGRPRLLEIGCGQGSFAAQLGGICDYRGIEFNQAAVAKATAAGYDVERRSVEDEARERPGRYDVVCHFQVLEHVPDVAGFMRACVDLLRPGGMLVVTVPAEDSFVGLASGVWLNMPPHHVTRWSDLALTRLYERLDCLPPTLWHESVASYHADWYQSVVRQYALARFGNRPAPLAGPNLAAKVAQRLGNVGVLGGVLDRAGSRSFPYADRGHSVTACGIKRGSAAA